MTEETKRPEDKFDFDGYTQTVVKAVDGLTKIMKEDGHVDVGPLLTRIVGEVATAIGSIADSLQRIANAQEMIAQLTNIDLDATIQQGSRILYAEMKAKENAGNEN